MAREQGVIHQVASREQQVRRAEFRHTPMLSDPDPAPLCPRCGDVKVCRACDPVPASTRPAEPGPLDLEAIEGRHGAATTGSWMANRTPNSWWMLLTSTGRVISPHVAREEDAEFIAYAHADIEALLAEVRRLREVQDYLGSVHRADSDELDRLRAELAVLWRDREQGR